MKTDEVMNYRGLSEYLKLSQGTLRHKVMRNEIPFFKIGSSVRFSKTKIDAWLDGLGGTKQSVAESSAEVSCD